MRYFLFALLSMFVLFACSIDDVVTAEASKITQSRDFDVGDCFTETSADITSANYTHGPKLCIVQTPVASMSSEASTSPEHENIYYALQPRHRAQPNKPWEGGNTKASLCEAIVNTSSQYSYCFDSQPYAFGKDIRRLTCEAKA